ncbi:MAG TPA: glycine--tRNA ligase [Planctomycetota bacterium]|nr:glycine--tRNA ligase [Planctomycetota bacterium]
MTTSPSPAAARPADLMKKLVALCKSRGFVFQSSEIYGGLKSAYDYGPLGAELKRNLMGEWWKDMVTTRENVVGLDASIIMHPDVWRASGHAAGFSDPLVDDLVSKERFRADKAPRPSPGDELPITCPDKGVAKDWAEQIEKRFGVALERDANVLRGMRALDAKTVGFFPKGATSAAQTFPWRGYVSPTFGSPFLSDERQFNLMFRTALGAVDPMQDVAIVLAELTAAPELAAALKAKFGAAADEGALAKAIADGDRTRMLRAAIEQITSPNMAFLRPETAQAMFVQFKNVMDSLGLKPPFGIAQMGKSFRNEVTVEHFIFRSCEFEQMEMEFFCEPGTQKEWMAYWKEQRMAFWRRYANYPEHFKFRQHASDEMAFYADDCYDVEYLYPWGWGELEGIASRTDYDLSQHEKHSGVKLRYVDQEKEDPETKKKPWIYKPYVIEPAAGATRGLLCFLLDAYHEEQRTDAEGKPVTRTVLKLHPKLAPITCAVLPLVRKDGHPEKAREIIQALLAAGVAAKYDEKHAIGKRYARHDEIGTPWCITVDGQTIADGTVTLRDRDTTQQVRIPATEAVQQVRERLEKA